ncbi:CHAT domain-containing protein [Leptothoe sp. PORK10 BA2]|nr:CHAT domain-containing protein [Leptothoe sp. PORK10 BA2]
MHRLRRLSLRRWIGLSLLAILTMVTVLSTTLSASAQDTILHLSGALTDTDAQFASDNSRYDAYTFEGKEGQTVLLSLASVNFDSYLILLSPDGEPVAENDDVSPFSRHAQILSRLPQAGTYTVYANAQDAAGRGAYELKISHLSAAAYDLQQQALSHQIEGETAFLQNDYTTAVTQLETALKLYRQTPHPPSIAATLNILARVYLIVGRTDPILPAYEESLGIYQQLNREGDAVRVLNNMGSFFYSQSNYPSALATYERALAIAQNQQDVDAEASLLGHIGLVLTDVGQLPQALTLLEQALALKTAINDQEGISAVLNNLGRIYDLLGQFDRALDYMKRSLEFSQQLGNRQSISLSLANIGAVYQSRKDYDQAIDYYQQALAIQQEIEDPFGKALALNNLGTTYDKLGRLDEALELFQQSLQIFQDLGNQSAIGRNLSNIGLIYFQLGQEEQAETYYQRGLSQVQAVGDRYAEALILEHLAELRWQFKRYDDAEPLVRQAILILDQLRDQKLSDADKVAIFDLQQKTYQALQYILIKQDRGEAALIAAEQGRARAFAELITQNSNLPLPTVDDSLDGQAIRKIAQQQQATIVEYTILDQLDVADQYYAWVITPQGDLTLRSLLVNEANLDEAIDLDQLVSLTRGELGDSHRGWVATQAGFQTIVNPGQGYRKLYQQLIEPLEDLLPTDPMEQVVLVPQGNLFLVPFPALKSSEGEYLIAEHTLQTIPSIQVLDLTQQLQTAAQATTSAQDMLVVGNPIMPSIWQADGDLPLPPLPGAQEEAQSVAALLKTEALLGAQATEKQIKQRSLTARVIHLATHGLLDYGDPRESGVRDMPGAIALTPSDGEDGLLTSAEILNLDLTAELVVLSACDTGRGDITSDGVLGLSRSLITAGVPNVIVSLWAIPDTPTADLMTAFYEQLNAGLDKAQALRQAMLQVQADYPNPRDWSGFTLIGPA